MSFWEFANPVKFTRLVGKWLPWVSAIAIICILVGLIWGVLFTPPDARQGHIQKIMYIHVPTAMMAVNIWCMMFVASLIWLVRRHHVSALAAKAAAPIGAVMTVLAIITGAIWGVPTWGTAWVWDPRLTSFAVLFVFYLGYIALWAAIDEADKAADLTAVLALVGSVFALLSRYAVLFWNQGLHQGASLSADRAQHVSNVFYIPLLISIIGFIALFLALVLYRTRTEIRARRLASLLKRQDQ